MAITEIRIHQEGDYLIPDVSSVPIVAGDTITFLAERDTPAKLCIPEATAAILSPPPEDSNTKIAAGGWVSFQFNEAAPGNYCILLQAPEYRCHSKISCPDGDGSTVLTIHPAGPLGYSGPGGDDWP